MGGSDLVYSHTPSTPNIPPIASKTTHHPYTTHPPCQPREPCLHYDEKRVCCKAKSAKWSYDKPEKRAYQYISAATAVEARPPALEARALVHGAGDLAH